MSKGTFLLKIMPGLLLISSAQAAELIKIDDSNFNQYMNQHKHNLIERNNNNSQYVLVKQVRLPNGTIKNKYIQQYQGIPVFSSLISTSETNGSEEQFWGVLLSDIKKDLPSVQPGLSEQDAIQKAIRHSNIPAGEKPSYENAKLFIKQNKTTEAAELVYLVSFNIYGNKPSRPHFFIDAKTGKILEQWEGLTTKDAQGPGGNEKTGVYYYGRDYRFLTVTDRCEMKTDNVETYNINGGTSGEVLYKFTCPENTYKQINGAFSPLNDAHFFGGMVYDMYQSWYKMAPIKGKLKLIVHYGQDFENAYWDGRQMVFGDGGEQLYPMTTIDILGHEVSHGVTEQNSGLVYKDQSGGINEAFSDMAGEAVKYYTKSQYGQENDWLVGDAAMKGPVGYALRYFKNPSKDGSSIENAKDYRDGLDVHFSSGVYNKAFYLLAVDQKWGVRKAFETFLLANKVYWPADATYNVAACGVAKAATDLGYQVSDVVTSFKAVGVNADCKAPEPTPAEVEIKNGETVQVKVTEGKDGQFVIKVPGLNRYPYSYKMLYIRLSDTPNNAKDSAELFVRYDQNSFTKVKPVTQGKDELFYIQYPAAGNYHILVRGKRTATLKLQAIYGN